MSPLRDLRSFAGSHTAIAGSASRPVVVESTVSEGCAAASTGDRRSWERRLQGKAARRMKHVEIKLEYEGPIEPPPEMLEELFARMLQDQPNERLVWMIAECA